jgi:uncharacterized protein (DUF427 family)
VPGVRGTDLAVEPRHLGALPCVPDGAVAGDVPAALVGAPRPRKPAGVGSGRRARGGDLEAEVPPTAPPGTIAAMTTATWNGAVLAESDDIVTVEGNAYFPRAAVRDDVLRPSAKHTICPWKGTASYYDVEVDGQVNEAAAWYYPAPRDAAKEIAGRVAFWRGVEVR